MPRQGAGTGPGSTGRAGGAITGGARARVCIEETATTCTRLNQGPGCVTVGVGHNGEICVGCNVGRGGAQSTVAATKCEAAPEFVAAAVASPGSHRHRYAA